MLLAEDELRVSTDHTTLMATPRTSPQKGLGRGPAVRRRRPRSRRHPRPAGLPRRSRPGPGSGGALPPTPAPPHSRFPGPGRRSTRSPGDHPGPGGLPSLRRPAGNGACTWGLPFWMRHRLSLAGMRPSTTWSTSPSTSSGVGEPLHAFDFTACAAANRGAPAPPRRRNTSSPCAQERPVDPGPCSSATPRARGPGRHHGRADFEVSPDAHRS